MPRYYFNIPMGKYAGAADAAFVFNNDDEAWKEMTTICSDIIADVARDCAVTSSWRMETLDETKKALFRISLVAESLA
jgi:hypothetical protein